MTYYAALDVSLRSVAICIVDELGKIQLEVSANSDVEDIVHCFTRFGEPIESVGLEAGTLTQYLTYGLQMAGFEVICMEARQVKNALSAMRNKTDKNDARGIAQLLRTGWYQRVHVKSIESHHIRDRTPAMRPCAMRSYRSWNPDRSCTQSIRSSIAA